MIFTYYETKYIRCYLIFLDGRRNRKIAKNGKKTTEIDGEKNSRGEYFEIRESTSGKKENLRDNLGKRGCFL